MKGNIYPVLNDAFILRAYEIEKKERFALWNIYNTKPIELNKDAYFLVRHFTGEYSIRDIISKIRKSYSISQNEAIKKLKLILIELKNKNVIFFQDKKTKKRKFYEKKKMKGLLSHIYVLLTNACNLKCKHCSVNAGKRLKNELEKNHFFYLIDQISEMMIPSITFTGGEPTLVEFLPELINYASKKPMRVGLMTNGLKINKAYAKLLVENGLSHVNISIDGIKEKTHDNFRGVAGSFKKALEAIKIFRNWDIYVETTTVIHKGNCDEIRELVKLGKRIGINNMKFIPVIPYKRGKACDFYTSLQCYIANIKNFKYYWDETRIIKENLKEKITKRKLFRCNAGEGVLTIGPNGNVYPCNNLQEIILGNLRNRSLYDIYTRPKNLLKLKKAIQIQNSECEACNILDECRGGCPAIAYSYFGSYNKCDITRKAFIIELLNDSMEEVKGVRGTKSPSYN